MVGLAFLSFENASFMRSSEEHVCFLDQARVVTSVSERSETLCVHEDDLYRSSEYILVFCLSLIFPSEGSSPTKCQFARCLTHFRIYSALFTFLYFAEVPWKRYSRTDLS